MALCERENEWVNRCLYVYDLAKIPINMASKTDWKRRGYKVAAKRGMGKVEYWNGQHYQNFTLYNFTQVECIRGKKAQARRVAFWERFEKNEVPF